MHECVVTTRVCNCAVRQVQRERVSERELSSEGDVRSGACCWRPVSIKMIDGSRWGKAFAAAWGKLAPGA